ncbi:hypothetical protein WJX81_004762 [Elliptochloris bilobata]|uniref:Uncharacterized protein n=1 Tax=Elliptochloris bilobata TaxID=381761 RepID=A0AAW1QZ84_9CHLO
MCSVVTQSTDPVWGWSGASRGEGRSKLDLAKEVKTVEPRVDNSGGGGNNGKSIFNGGGGGDDGGDDDDYFDNFDDGEGNGDGDGFFRAVLAQLYDEASINAVMQEWFRTVADLPLIIRQAVSMGLFSSAQLVRFLSMDVRPSVTRAVTRRVPPQVARGVVGRLMADPAFAQKLLIEEAITICASLSWELQQRRERFGRELDFVAINTLSLAAATGALVWLVSPNRSYGALHKFSWQNYLHRLPNHIFDASTPLNRLTPGARAAGFAAKAAELCAVGTIAGAAMSGLAQVDLRLRRMRDPGFTPSVPVPDICTSAGGLAVTMGVFTNMRFQVVGGIDRYLFDHSNYLFSYLALSTAFRAASTWIGQPTRLHLQGLPVEPPRVSVPEPQPAPRPAAA